MDIFTVAAILIIAEVIYAIVSTYYKLESQRIEAQRQIAEAQQQSMRAIEAPKHEYDHYPTTYND